MLKKLVFTAFILFGGLATTAVQAQYNNWAAGFRLGEPAGINLRKYFGDNKAFDINVGTYGGLYGNHREYRRGVYRSVGLTVQGHYLWHNRLFGKDELRGYYGFGGQINTRRYYPERLQTINEYESGFSLGGSAVAGLDYFVPNKPFSVFLETGLYVEVLPAPFFLNVQSGLGLRYNF